MDTLYARHGDLTIHKIEKLPKDLKQLQPKADGGLHIGGGSADGGVEHVVYGPVQAFATADGRGVYLAVEGDAEVTHSTRHKTLKLVGAAGGGAQGYSVFPQREGNDEAWERVMD